MKSKLNLLLNSSNPASRTVGKIFQRHNIEVKPQTFLQLTKDLQTFLLGTKPKLFKKLDWQDIQAIASSAMPCSKPLEQADESMLSMRINFIKSKRERVQISTAIADSLEGVYEEILRHLMKSLMEDE